MTSSMSAFTIDLIQLAKLRICVARFGEMDRAGWWNSKGMLGSSGRSVLSRGLPRTAPFAQARVACAVAAHRCQELFAPPECLTLWNLSPEIENALEGSWPLWSSDLEGDGGGWKSFFDRVASRDGDDLCGELAQEGLLDEAVRKELSGLPTGAGGSSIALPGTGELTPGTAQLLAGAFSLNPNRELAVPYLRIAA